ncbi:hypothetical protein ACIREM_39110 [Streptomyces shenzhenensis]|uniref:hypothetical protein n=1 Tax=Streptomyces shenzhenensis TaxID=943815 RepID=UPI003822FBFA
MNAAPFLIGACALARFLRGNAEHDGRDRRRDFECTAAGTGRALQWCGPEAGK